MGTPFSNIYDLCLVDIRDYRLDYLYDNNQQALYSYLEGLLIKSIPKFVGCLESLEYNVSTSTFNNVLSLKAQDILADYMVITWMEQNTNDATQINLKLQGRDKKSHQSSTNLKEKSERLDRMREKVRQDECDYQLNFDVMSY